MNKIAILPVLLSLAACNPQSGVTPMPVSLALTKVEPPAPFPTVKGDNLLGETYHLPVDFDGEINLVLVAYRRYQQTAVNTWLTAAKQLDREFLGFEYYELPVIHRGYKVMRFIIDNGMRRGIPSSEARRRTITIFDKGSFNRQLRVTRTDRIRALLVDGKGNIRWSTTGVATPSALASLRQAVQQALGKRWSKSG